MSKYLNVASTMSDEAAIITAFIGLIVFFFAIAAVITIITVIAEWKVFKKAGREGWFAIIPVYNSWVLCEVVGISPYWVLIALGCSFVSGLFSAVPALAAVVSLAAVVVNAYYKILLSISLARSFGKSDGFGVVTFFFMPICMLILGFSDAKYLGPKPMNDVVFNAINQKKEEEKKEEPKKEHSEKEETKKEETKKEEKKDK